MGFDKQELVQYIEANNWACLESFGMMTLEIPVQDLVPLMTRLKTNPTCGFEFLTDLCGIEDVLSQPSRLGVVYHLHNFKDNVRLRVKVYVPHIAPNVPSLTDLFPCANWMERETYDFFGIHFEGHPNLVRILNVDDMVVFPMRKSHPLEDDTRDDKDDSLFGR